MRDLEHQVPIDCSGKAQAKDEEEEETLGEPEAQAPEEADWPPEETPAKPPAAPTKSKPTKEPKPSAGKRKAKPTEVPASDEDPSQSPQPPTRPTPYPPLMETMVCSPIGWSK